MKLADLAVLLPKARHDWTVTFRDGDRYAVADLDCWGDNGNGEFEIYVDFANCLGQSSALAKALRSESLKDAFWTSSSPRKPIGNLYYLEDVEAVFDEDKGYFIYRA